MTCQSPAGAPGPRSPRDHHAGVGRRQHEIGAVGRMRVGIAEKEQEKRGRTRNGTHHVRPSQSRDEQRATSRAPRTKGHPARSMNICSMLGVLEGNRASRQGCPAAKVLRGQAAQCGRQTVARAVIEFHAVFDLQFALLETDFFELLGVREVVVGFEFVQAIVE